MIESNYSSPLNDSLLKSKKTKSDLKNISGDKKYMAQSSNEQLNKIGSQNHLRDNSAVNIIKKPPMHNQKKNANRPQYDMYNALAP